jgi:hypothetical protein
MTFSSRILDKFPIYAAIGVPEVWCDMLGTESL